MPATALAALPTREANVHLGHLALPIVQSARDSAIHQISHLLQQLNRIPSAPSHRSQSVLPAAGRQASSKHPQTQACVEKASEPCPSFGAMDRRKHVRMSILDTAFNVFSFQDFKIAVDRCDEMSLMSMRCLFLMYSGWTLADAFTGLFGSNIAGASCVSFGNVLLLNDDSSSCTTVPKSVPEPWARKTGG